MENKTYNIELTEAEAKMILEAVGTWSAGLSQVRFETNSQRIMSVVNKIDRQLRPYGA